MTNPETPNIRIIGPSHTRGPVDDKPCSIISNPCSAPEQKVSRTGRRRGLCQETLLVLNGIAWGDFFSAVTSIQNLARLGIGTTADATNPLSAKLNNTLLAAKTVAEGGDGKLRNKFSK
jgi:hypothetical protein